ncbi:MAG: tetratricopeptide repeat protein [Candidatus Omnitrophica bacterium]|nr:tetratricopeptide repeat protein [Candidatus Omnitrophota bacterium]
MQSRLAGASRPEMPGKMPGLRGWEFAMTVMVLSIVFLPAVSWSQNEKALELRVRGFQAQQRGSIDEAIDLYKKAAEADPAYATPHNDLGILYEDQGKLTDAEREYLAATALDPNYAGAYTNIASLYDRQGRLEESLTMWRRRAQMGDAGDRWRKQAEERIADLEAQKTVQAPAAPDRPFGAAGPSGRPPLDQAASSGGGGADQDQLSMAEQIAQMIVQEQEAKGGGSAPAPVGYTTVRLAPPGSGAAAPTPSGDWYQRTKEAQEDLLHEEEEVSKLGPEVHAKYLLGRAKLSIAANDYQRAIELLDKARQLDPDEILIDKLYHEAREKQIEAGIARSTVDAAVYNRRKMMDVEGKWFPPKPEEVEPFDSSKYIVKGSEKSAARLELERKAKQVVPSIDFTDAKLKDVVEFLAVANDINIIVDEAAVPADERVTVHLKNIPLVEALDIILRTKGLKYRPEENIIWITSAERLLEEDLEVRVYDVQDLVGKLYDFPSKPFDFEKFVEPEKKTTS